MGQSFSALRPLLYTLALLYVAADTGLSKYSFYNSVDPQEGITGQITVSHILQALATFFAIRLLLKVATGFVMNGYYNRNKIDSGSQFAINRLLTYFVYLVGVLLVIQAMGFDLVVIWTGAAALLVGIGIGLQQTFNDLICGVIILFERSVKVGDVVELGGEHQVGTVRKIGARTSVVETRDDIIIFVPNSKLIGENVTNWSQVKRIARFHVKVGVAYGSDTELVRKTLLEVATNHARVLKSPPCNVRFLNFGDSSLDFDVMFYSRDFLRIEDVKSDIRFAIDQAFRKANVEIPFPQRDLHIRSSVIGSAGGDWGPGGGGVGWGIDTGRGGGIVVAGDRSGSVNPSDPRLRWRCLRHLVGGYGSLLLSPVHGTCGRALSRYVNQALMVGQKAFVIAARMTTTNNR